MKQGTANSRPGDQKVEPNSTANNPGGADGIGQHMGNHSSNGGTFTPKITSIDAGRGYSAPAIGSTSHKCGSQGKY